MNVILLLKVEGLFALLSMLDMSLLYICVILARILILINFLWLCLSSSEEVAMPVPVHCTYV